MAFAMSNLFETWNPLTFNFLDFRRMDSALNDLNSSIAANSLN